MNNKKYIKQVLYTAWSVVKGLGRDPVGITVWWIGSNLFYNFRMCCIVKKKKEEEEVDLLHNNISFSTECAPWTVHWV